MRRTPRPARPLAVGIAVAVGWGALAMSPGVLAQDPVPDMASAECIAEVEPNGTPDEALSLSDVFCLTGTLPEKEDQDLYLWEVSPEDGMTRWAITIRGIPAAITSAHFITIASPPGVLPMETAGELARADSDAHLGTAPVTTTIRFAPGQYLVGISRSAPGFNQQLTDDLSYEVRMVRTGELPPTGDVEPNDDATTATPVTGAFELSGDLQATVDHYRWTVTSEDASSPQRLEAQTAIGAPLTIQLLTGAGEPISSASASADGLATLHDLGLAAGEYDIAVSPASSQVQLYTLASSPVTSEAVDPEPNDTPELAMALNPTRLSASGRVTTDSDIDQYVFDLDSTLA